MIRFLSSTLLLLASTQSLIADDQAMPQVVANSARLDRIFEKWNRVDTPGCAVAVMHKGEIVDERGVGMANLDSGMPNSLDTVFRVGSVSKQMTAACIALLSLGQRLSLDDCITKYVPELSDVHKT